METLSGIFHLAEEIGLEEGFVKIEESQSTLTLGPNEKSYFISIRIASEDYPKWLEGFPKENESRGIFNGDNATLLYSCDKGVVLEVEGSIEIDESFNTMHFGFSKEGTEKVARYTEIAMCIVKVVIIALILLSFFYFSFPLNLFVFVFALFLAYGC